MKIASLFLSNFDERFFEVFGQFYGMIDMLHNVLLIIGG